MLVQLSCVSRHYKDRRRENRGGRRYSMPDRTEFLQRQAQVEIGTEKRQKAKEKLSIRSRELLPLQPRQR